MIKIPETSPYYLATNQSEESPQAATFTPNVAFKNPSLKVMREFRSLEHGLPVLFAWCPVINAICSFTLTWCQLIGFAVHRWGSVNPSSVQEHSMVVLVFSETCFLFKKKKRQYNEVQGLAIFLFFQSYFLTIQVSGFHLVHSSWNNFPLANPHLLFCNAFSCSIY